MSRPRFACLLFVSLLPAVAGAEVVVSGAWSRALPPVSVNGAAYLTLANESDTPDVLLTVESPQARMVHLHETRIDNGVAAMSMVERLEIPPGGRVVLAPGGAHLMLMGLTAPLRKGGTLPLRLRFEHAGEIEVEVPVLGPGATGPQ